MLMLTLHYCDTLILTKHYGVTWQYRHDSTSPICWYWHDTKQWHVDVDVTQLLIPLHYTVTLWCVGTIYWHVATPIHI